MTFDSFLHKITEIKSILPAGLDAHKIMTPIDRFPFIDVNNFIDRNPRQSAVMMLCYPVNNEPNILLIEREVYDGVHSGQIAFPGGKSELDDPSLMYTALRETDEEVGINPNTIEVIRSFTQVYVPPSNFVIQPFLGVLTEQPKLTPSEMEVAKIIELPLSVLLDDSIIQSVHMKTSYAANVDVPAFVHEGFTIWGATAMMLSELKQTLKMVLNEDGE